MKRGLSATLELQRDITNKKTIGLYKSSQELLSNAMSAYYQTVQAGLADHSQIVRVENNIRRNLLDMFWENAAAYGNEEVRRVKKSDETIGPLNQRFNICGAGLRNFGMVMFPFPDPEFFGYQTRKVDGKSTTFRSMGYSRDSYGPHTPLVHPDLPSLDFVDTIRHHLDYLATFCYIYDVPPDDTGRYWNLYQLRVRPYLEHMYTESSSGKKGFREGTRRVLREIKDDIRKHYKTRSGDTPTVTGSLDVAKPSFSIGFFSDLIAEAKSRGIDDPSLYELERIHEGGCAPHGINEPCLRSRDVRNIWHRLNKRVLKIGSQVHRHISSQQSSPWTLRNAILNGDSLESNDKCLVCFEVPLDTVLGKGKADIVLLERVTLANETRIFWKPVMVLEIKTKLGHSMTLGRQDIWSESRAHHDLEQRVVADFRFGNRELDSDEWESIIQATPTDTSQKQLDAYSNAIWKEYLELTSSEEPNVLITGTILLDAMENTRLTRDMMRGLVIRTYCEINRQEDYENRLLFEPRILGLPIRVAVVMNKRPYSFSVDGTRIEQPWCPAYDPLQLSRTDGHQFILYLDGKSPTSSGYSAGWIAKYFHGLLLLKELVEKNKYSGIVWLDLADQFVNPRLAEARLHLRPYSRKDKDVQRSHTRNIQQLFESIHVRGLLQSVDGFMFRNKSLSALQNQLNKLPNEDCLIIVSGMETIREATPHPHRWKLDLLLSSLLSRLPKHESVSILWFDSPVPGEGYSTAYSTRALLPYYETSPMYGEVNEIVWNLPVVSGCEAVPDRWTLPTLAKTPYHDDIRIIITQDENGFSIESTLIPPLTDWSKRFKAEGLGRETTVSIVDDAVPDASVRARMEILALSLIPWIVDLWPTLKLDAGHGYGMAIQRYNHVISEYQVAKEHVSLSVRTLKELPKKEPSLLDRVKFRPTQVRGGKSFVPVTVGAINSQKLYRKPRKILTKQKRLSQASSPQKQKELVELADIRFGLVFSSEKLGYEWRAIINPTSTSSLMVGLFKADAEMSGERLDWAESRLDIVSKMSSQFNRFNDVITEYIFQRNSNDLPEKSCWNAWSRSDDLTEWTNVGVHNHVLRSGGSKVRLRAFRIWSENEQQCVPPPNVQFPNFLRSVVQSSIEGIARQLRDVKHVRLRLSMQGNECVIIFQDSENKETLHSLILLHTADIIRLLRWPMTEGKPLRLRHDLLVTWNLFHDFAYPSPDIDFGDDFRFLEESLISLTTSEEMMFSPVLVDTALNLRTLQVTVHHDASQCPLVKDPRLNHSSCWRISLPPELQSMIEIKTDQYLTDKQVFEHVEEVSQMIGNNRVELVFDHGLDEHDRLVFNESEVMRKLSNKYRGIPLQSLSPGHTSRIKIRLKRLKRERNEGGS